MAFSELKDKITILVDGSKREFFMSFGLLNELARLAANPQGASFFTVDPDMIDEVRKSLLAERSPGGKILSEIEDPNDFAISVPDTEKMLTWAMEHVLDFFVRAAKVVKAASEAVDQKMEEDQKLSPSGSKD